MIAIKWPQLFPTPQTTIFSCVWNLWRLETMILRVRMLNPLWNCKECSPSLSLPKQGGGKSEGRTRTFTLPLRMAFGCVGPALRQPHVPMIFLYRRELTFIAPHQWPYALHICYPVMLIPSYPGSQGSEKLWPCSSGVPSSHIQYVKSNTTKSVPMNLSSLLAFLKYSKGSM